jgi:hypothetical protein
MQFICSEFSVDFATALQQQFICSEFSVDFATALQQRVMSVLANVLYHSYMAPDHLLCEAWLSPFGISPK